MVFWIIVDTDVAAKRAMEILKIEDQGYDENNVSEGTAIKTASKHISTLR